MPTINYNQWEPVGIALGQKYKKRYWTPERLPENLNPLRNLVVLEGIDRFFGTKVCNIFIVGLLFGWRQSGEEWVEDWPPTGYADAKARHIDTFKYFSKYETHVYMDYNLVAKVEAADPETDFRRLMNGTKGRMQEMCSDLAAYGFTMEPDIVGEVGAEYFYDVLDPFMLY